MPKFLDTVEVEATAKFLKSATDTIGSVASHALFLDLDTSQAFLGIRLGTDSTINFDTYNGASWIKQIFIDPTVNSVTFKREVIIGRPGGPEGYGYGYGEDNASTGTLTLYGDFYCDDDAVFAENIFVGGTISSLALSLFATPDNPGGSNTLWVDSDTNMLMFGPDPIQTGTSGVTSSGTPSPNQVAYWTSASSITGDPDFTFDGADVVIGQSAVSDGSLSVYRVNIGALAHFERSGGGGYSTGESALAPVSSQRPAPRGDDGDAIPEFTSSRGDTAVSSYSDDIESTSGVSQSDASQVAAASGAMGGQGYSGEEEDRPDMGLDYGYSKGGLVKRRKKKK